ncbi:MAG: 6-phosphogluconolactonase [Prevotella sp.]|nr:6-phosphogluconolactonase [Prevotella sp.]MDY4218503.1 6-phosphogluconolactonase [Prevotella sp.]
MKKNIYPKPEDAARALILHILQLAEQSPRPVFNIALSGGNTPALMFDIWASEFLRQTQWERLRFFWVDERCVPPTDRQSNYGMTRRHLFDHVPIADCNIFRIHGENDPQDEAERYAALVAKEVACIEGMPVFDFVLLGAGDDGHTSSIFPGQEELLHTEETYAVSAHPETQQLRIALTAQPILHALNIAFLMTGPSKAPILQSFSDPEEMRPAAFVVKNALREVEIFADEAAGRKQDE